MSEPLIFLCNPPSPPSSVADREVAYGMGGQHPAPPLAQPPHTLAWCGARLQQTGWRVEALDAVAERLTPNVAVARLTARQPTLVILLVSPQTAASDLAFVQALRAALPAARLMLVGLATHYLPASLAKAADMVLVGEPEGAIDAACRRLLTAGETVRVLNTPQALDAPGYDSAGHLIDLSFLPPPAWHLFPVGRYSYLPVVGSRGCAHSCHYCPVPLTQGSTLRVRLAERVAAEMHLLHSRYGVRQFTFLDPLFGADRTHTEALCHALIRWGLPTRVTWQCESRAEYLDLSLLQRMARAGCRTLHLGLESVSPETLMAIGRLRDEKAAQAYLTAVRQVLLGCRAFGIESRLHIMAGLPGDRAAATATRAFLRAYPPDSIHISPLTPYPGTSAFPTNQIEREVELLEETMQREPARWWRTLARPNRLPTT